MKLNKLLIVSILLLAILSIGAVSAASENVTADENAVVGGDRRYNLCCLR